MRIVAIGIGEIGRVTMDAEERDQNGSALGNSMVSAGNGVIFSALAVQEGQTRVFANGFYRKNK